MGSVSRRDSFSYFLVDYFTEFVFTELKFSIEAIRLFVARFDELTQLAKAIKQSNHAALVYGKRRVGKTGLTK